MRAVRKGLSPRRLLLILGGRSEDMPVIKSPLSDILGIHPKFQPVALSQLAQNTLEDFFSVSEAKLLAEPPSPEAAALNHLGTPAISLPSLKSAEVYCNDLFLEAIGLDRDSASFELISLATLVHHEDKKRLLAMCTSLQEGVEVVRANLRLASGEHGYQWYILQGRLNSEKRSSEGSLVFVLSEVNDLATAANIENRRSSNIDFIEGGEAFGVYNWNVIAGTTMQWSDSQYRLMGYAPGGIESTVPELCEHIHVDDQAGVRDALNELLNSQGTVEKEFRLRRKVGGYIWVRSASAIRVSDHGEKHIVGIMYSVADKYLAERSARIARQDMEEFVYSLTHDLRAPIRHISSFVTMLIESGQDNLTPEQDSYLSYTSNAAKKLGHMLDGLLSHNRLKDLGSEAVWFSLDAAVQRVVTLIPKTDRADVELDIQPLPFAFGVLAQIEQLFFILLHNAFIYSAERDDAKIIVRYDPNHHRGPAILVEDNGIGFDSRYIKKLFKFFERLHETPNSGVGVGLATAKRIVNLHHGTIWGQGKLNQGATFGFTLPKLSEIAPVEDLDSALA